MDASLSDSEAYLEVSGADAARKVPVGAQPITIGRHSQNLLMISDNKASRFHCMIGRGKDGFWVRDLNSSNGTLLNGKRVTTAEMYSDDVVTIGGVRITLHAPGQRPSRQAAAEPSFRGQEAGEKLPAVEDLEIVDDVSPLSQETWLPAEITPAVEGLDYAAPAPSLDDLESLAVEHAPEALTDLDIVEDEGPLPIASDEADLHVAGFDDDVEQVLTNLADSLPERAFGTGQIALASARGQLVHPADGSSRGKRGGGDTVDIFRLMLLVCARSRATDIHVEPRDSVNQVRMRVDGSMVDVVRLAPASGVRLAALVKVLSEIDVSQKTTVQEGHFSARVPGSTVGSQRRIDYRVSFAPSVFGQKLVIRVLDTSHAPLSIRALDLPPWMREEVETAVRQDAGMVLVCGPTGSGKTTTLYALVRGSDVSRRNVVTIEDPVEIQIESVTQIPVDEEHDKSFSNLLRSVLRQDPDVILIGEIRDAETARIAMQAAITGHLVFSTIHTKDTAGTVFRLLDLGVEPYLVAQALHLVLAQRLARQLCPNCKVAVDPTPRQLEKMGPTGAGVSRIYQPGGCPRCLGTGFAGRRAFFELLVTSDELRDLIVRNPTAGQIQAALANTPFQRLQHSGYQLVASGVVGFDEIERAMGR